MAGIGWDVEAVDWELDKGMDRTKPEVQQKYLKLASKAKVSLVATVTSSRKSGTSKFQDTRILRYRSETQFTYGVFLVWATGIERKLKMGTSW